MKLVQIEIEYFRGIEKLSLTLDDTTILIGENNTGKSSILDALQICLSRRLTGKGSKFAEYDYHLPDEDSQPSDVSPITITLRFKERTENEWPDSVLQTFDKALQVDPDDGLNSLALRVTSSFESGAGDYLTQWDFIDGAGNVMTGAKNPRLIISLQQIAPVFYLAALRDAAQEFRPRSKFWGPFVKSVQIEDGVREELEQALSELNQRVLDTHTAFDGVKERLNQTTRLIPMGVDEPVHIQALPGKVFDMLSRTQVMLSCRSGAKLPLYRHGEGTQSMAVLFLFDAFLRTRLTEDYDDDTEPFLALEEPEAHLHPSAIRSLGTLLQDLKGQSIIATHSGDLLASVPLQNIRRLARKDGKIECFCLHEGTLSADDIQKVAYHIRSQRGFLLFGRCWLLVEGQSEYRLLPEFSRQLSLPFDIHGVCCVEFSQFGKLDILIKLADDLGIDWHVLTDNDAAGQGYSDIVIEQLNGRDQQDHLTKLPDKDIEHFLWNQGFDYIYKQQLSRRQLGQIGVPESDPEYPSRVIKAAINKVGKPSLATEVAIETSKPSTPGVPAVLNSMLTKVVSLAERSI